MGNYNPITNRDGSSVADTLKAAEEDHFLDCPDAEIRIRIAALLLDIILAALAVSGLQNVCLAVQAHLSHLALQDSNDFFSFSNSLRLFLTANATSLSAYAYICLRLAFLYFYFIWAMVFAGGSPGKLLLGLRVVDKKTGSYPNLSNAFLRELARAAGLAFGGMTVIHLLLSKDKKILHDLVSDTVVKRIHGRL